MTLGERICAQRMARHFSQSDLAERLEVSRQSVSKWETDASVPDLDKLVKMCEVFGISLDQLVRGEEEPAAPKPGEELPPTSTQAAPSVGSVTVRTVVGLMLLFLGALVVLLCFLFQGVLLSGLILILASLLLLCGAVCLLCKRHPALVCGWMIWGTGVVYLPYATGIRLWWMFDPRFYRQGIALGALIAWGLALIFFILFGRTIWLFWRRNSHAQK